MMGGSALLIWQWVLTIGQETAQMRLTKPSILAIVLKACCSFTYTAATETCTQRFHPQRANIQCRREYHDIPAKRGVLKATTVAVR
eukprot:512350-Amphidinium_carterae.1